MKNIIINGFDRCGSSMICRVLAKHPEISMMFQPTNSTEIHRDLFKFWFPEEEHSATKDFFDSLEGEVDKEYISSIWFDKFSDLKPDAKINLIKETKCHLKVDWLSYNLPDIDFYGIWRDPRGILGSLVRNNFHIDWYKTDQSVEDSAQIKILKLIKELGLYDELKDSYDFLEGPVENMAFTIVVMLQIMATSVKPSDWLVYEDIIDDPNKYFNRFLNPYGISYFDFEPHLQTPYNVSGHMGNKDPYVWKTMFKGRELDRLNTIFSSLFKLREVIQDGQNNL